MVGPMISSTPRVTAVKDIEQFNLNPKVLNAAVFKPTVLTRKDKLYWKRNVVEKGCNKSNNFDDVKPSSLNERAAVVEASRCLKCADAPCTKSCPTQIDVKSFIQCIQSKNFYGAAKQILTDNPIGLSCGMVCPVSELCVGSCNLDATEEGAININGLQHFAVQRFMEMQVPQIKDPRQPIIDKKVAIIGAGPASLSCANFLGRLGYQSIEVFEKSHMPGGLSSLEIPQFRLPFQAVSFETRLCRDLGVQFHYSKEFGKDFGLKELTEKYDAIFLGCGLYQPKTISAFSDLSATNNIWTSKDFLPLVSGPSKNGCGCGDHCSSLPDLGNHVVVLGAGDTAFDCATSAFRCGAKRVTIVFRKSWSDMRAVPEERELAMRELCDFLPNARPKAVHLDGQGKVESLELVRTEKNDEEEYLEDLETSYKLNCSAIITAFGCSLHENVKLGVAGMLSIDSNSGMIQIGNDGSSDSSLLPLQALGCSNVFLGGDIAGGVLTVEAANDGKVAASSIHQFLSSSSVLTLPAFTTPIDLVDLSIEMCGVKFPNPFGLASAPCCTSGSMIRRAFEQGWGFAVVKTFTLDKYMVTNVTPRIIRGTLNHRFGPAQNSFLNIELISEKTASYWVQAMRELKNDFPQNIVIASIMVPYVQEEWEEITKLALLGNPDMIELNLSCPHGMGEVGMGLACGQEEQLVEDICRWVKAVAGDIPVFAKLTPNVTEIAQIAMAAERGGADGVTAINTVSGIMDTNGKGEPWPRIGKKQFTTRGGISGDQNRPVGLRACAMIRQYCPKLAIMGTGGVSSADSTLQYIRMGASVVQICSSIQNQDFTVIEDYITGLRTHLYQMGRRDMKDWDGQTPPVTYGTSSISKLPHFGKFHAKRVEMRKREALMEKEASHESKKSAQAALAITESVFHAAGDVSLKQLVNYSTSNFVRNHNDLSREEFVVAVIHDELCINCGKCYMTCNDNAYQAITFDPFTHQAKVMNDKCTGCGLCSAVCPIPNCIDFQPRTADSPHVIKRWA